MLKCRFLAAACLLLAPLAACTTASLEELRQTTPSGSPFQAALAAEYLAFSESEAHQYDWADSKHFADKGLKAAYGKEVEPEHVGDWRIAPEQAIVLTAARGELMAALHSGVKAAKPQLAARAQFFYDCWVEQQEEAWQEDDITSCKVGFYHALKEMTAQPPAAHPMAEPEITKPLIFSSSYIVFFEWNKAAVTAEAMQIIQTVAADLHGVTNYEVVLHGHADRSGDAAYNLKLSKARAEAVKAELVRLGIPAGNIRYYAFGESDTRVPTANGVRNRANRRVEIFFEE